MLLPRTLPEHQTTQRLTKQLWKSGISYALIGGMAIRLHGARSFSKSVEVLVTPQGLDHFRQDLNGSAFDPVPMRSRRFVDRRNSVPIEVWLTGHHPGRTSPGPFTFPDPSTVSEEIHGIHVLRLPELIQFTLAGRRYSDLADVVFLIEAHPLDESLLPKLHPAVHRDYLRCLDEKRRDEQWQMQQA